MLFKSTCWGGLTIICVTSEYFNPFSFCCFCHLFKSNLITSLGRYKAPLLWIWLLIDSYILHMHDILWSVHLQHRVIMKMQLEASQLLCLRGRNSHERLACPAGIGAGGTFLFPVFLLPRHNKKNTAYLITAKHYIWIRV